MGIVVAVACACSLAFANVASAAFLDVNTTADETTPSPGGTGCSLREAVLTANGPGGFTECGIAGSSDIIRFDAGAFPSGAPVETIDLATVGGELTISSDIEIAGPGRDELTVTNSNLTDRIFRVEGAGPLTATISGLTITGGNVSAAATVRGGGIHLVAGDLSVVDARVSGNLASSTIGVGGTGSPVAVGGGIASNAAGTLRVRNSIIEGNVASATSNSAIDTSTNAVGGGISSGGSLILDRGTIRGNTAAETTNGGVAVGGAGGGGINSGGTLDAKQSTISGNSASSTATTTSNSSGGGVAMQGGTIELSTITGNTTSVGGAGADGFNEGGGIITGGAPVSIVSSTIADNGPAAGASTGANIFHFGVTLRNTIVADPRGGAPNCNTGVTSNGYNLEDGSSCNLSGTFDETGEPLLGPLLSNGGPTETRLPQPGSPVIDDGDSDEQTVSGDQRGLLRPTNFGGVQDDGDSTDIGAVEVQAGPVTFTGTTPSSPSSDDTPQIRGTVPPAPEITGENPVVQLFTVMGCSSGATGAPTAPATFASPGITVGPLAHNATTTLSARLTTDYGISGCWGSIPYTHVDPSSSTTPVTPVPGPTGERDAALKRCKQLKRRLQRNDRPWKKRYKKCRRKALALPV